MISKTQVPQPSSQAPRTAASPTKYQSRAMAKSTEIGKVSRDDRAGSAGGVLLDSRNEENTVAAPLTKADSSIAATVGVTPGFPSTPKPRRKPRKLNRQPAPSTKTDGNPEEKKGVDSNPTEPPATTDELKALKARVRGLEAKVEELYKSGAGKEQAGTGRSPRRRGKGKKGALKSARVVSPLEGQQGTMEDSATGVGVDEELIQLESELEDARLDLAAFRPRNIRKSSQDTGDDIEEIPRNAPGVENIPKSGSGTGRHVTLSGNYRIPLPASVSMTDVQNIQSGVSAAQNVARRMLEQRRNAQGQGRVSTTDGSADTRSAADITSKQSWGEWIGGYSMAISRAVKNIEHEAAMECQASESTEGATKSGQNGRRGSAVSAAAMKRSGRDRPGVKATVSAEQVRGLMR